MLKNQACPLSIIVPVLNESILVQRLLKQLNILRALGAEIIVVDGGSSDNTAQIATLSADQVLSVPSGRALQMNAGANIAKGDWLWFLHVDSILPDDIELWFNHLKHNQESQWGFFKITLSGHLGVFRVIESAINCRSSLTAVATGDQGIYMRREIFKQLNGFQAIPLMEDVAMSKQLKKISRPNIWQGKLQTSSRRWEEKGVLKTVVLMWGLRLGYFLGVKPKRLAKFYR